MTVLDQNRGGTSYTNFVQRWTVLMGIAREEAEAISLRSTMGDEGVVYTVPKPALMPGQVKCPHCGYPADIDRFEKWDQRAEMWFKIEVRRCTSRKRAKGSLVLDCGDRLELSREPVNKPAPAVPEARPRPSWRAPFRDIYKAPAAIEQPNPLIDEPAPECNLSANRVDSEEKPSMAKSLIHPKHAYYYAHRAFKLAGAPLKLNGRKKKASQPKPPSRSLPAEASQPKPPSCRRACFASSSQRSFASSSGFQPRFRFPSAC